MQKVKINPKSCTKHKGNRILSEFTKPLQKNFYIIFRHSSPARNVNGDYEWLSNNKKTHLSQHCASGIAIIDQGTPRQFLYEAIPHQLKRQKNK